MKNEEKTQRRIRILGKDELLIRVIYDRITNKFTNKLVESAAIMDENNIIEVRLLAGLVKEIKSDKEKFLNEKD